MKLFTLVILLFLAYSAKAQDYYPTILVLTPNETQYDPEFLDEIGQSEYVAQWTEEENEIFLIEIQNLEKNLYVMAVAETEYRRHGSFATKFSFTLYTMLMYLLFSNEFEPIVLPSHDKSDGNIEQLHMLAEKHNVQWIVNPVNLRTYKENEESFTTVTLHVYNHETGTIELEKTYTGDTSNPGFQLTCKEESLDCTIFNVIGSSLDDILNVVLADVIEALQQETTPGVDGPVLILLEGKEIAMEEVYDLDPDEIESIVVYKNPDDIRKYTSEDYEGVIIINMKKKGE